MFKKYYPQIGVGIFTIIMAVVLFYGMSLLPKSNIKVIDCGVSEISPDFTTEMREACRKARSGRV